MLGERIDFTVTTPAARHLFKINPEGQKLEERRKKVFHSITNKLLFTEKRLRPDIETTISFLCRRVTKSDEDDWKKLKRLLAYLKGTIDDYRIMGMDPIEETKMRSWIDASYAVHEDMKSHTGGTTSLGLGTLSNKSSVQKINVKSVCEAELVATSEYLPYNIWLKNFLEKQGYVVKENTIYQDNQSAIRLEKNGRNSCTGNSRHIDIRYFFVKDRVDKKELQIVYCPTEQMLADYFTKPLNGSLFKLYRGVIMGHLTIDKLFKHALKESVGNETLNQS